MAEQATSHNGMPEARFEPLIVGFTCNWCSYRAADLAGTSRVKYPPNVRLIRLMCSGRLDPSFVLKALAGGADGVLITGCHPGECHYLEQNYKALRRVTLLQHLLAQFGIEPQRVKLVWASAAEGLRLANEITTMVEEVRALGPLNWKQVAREPAEVLAVLNGRESDLAVSATTPIYQAAGNGRDAVFVAAQEVTA